MLYFDNASTTKISKSSLDSYISASEVFYNPSSLYAPSVAAKKIIEDARLYLIRTLLTIATRSVIFLHMVSCPSLVTIVIE